MKPLHKRGDKRQFGNYGSIALLISLSKIFERVMFDQLLTRAVTINRLESDRIDSSSQSINRFKTPESIH